MALTLVPLLSLPLAGMLIRRAGYRYDAWVLPIALGFHWLLIRGHGTDGTYLIAVTLFVALAAGAALRELGTSRERQPARARLTVLRRDQLSPTPSVEPATPRLVAAKPTSPPPRRPTETVVAPKVTVQVPEQTAAARSVQPPVDAAELLDRVEAAVSEEQRTKLLASLRSSAEIVACLRAATDSPHPVLGNAQTTVAHAWGDERRDGYLVRFDGVAPREATVLIVLCDVEDPAALLDESVRDAARGSALIIPSDLPGVKRLCDVGAADARWLARAVFVPRHLLIGDVDSAGRGAGAGETVTGRPA